LGPRRWTRSSPANSDLPPSAAGTDSLCTLASGGGRPAVKSY
jgi:hypothetical protein